MTGHSEALDAAGYTRGFTPNVGVNGTEGTEAGGVSAHGQPPCRGLLHPSPGRPAHWGKHLKRPVRPTSPGATPASPALHRGVGPSWTRLHGGPQVRWPCVPGRETAAEGGAIPDSRAHGRRPPDAPGASPTAGAGVLTVCPRRLTLESPRERERDETLPMGTPAASMSRSADAAQRALRLDGRPPAPRPVRPAASGTKRGCPALGPLQDPASAEARHPR